MVAGGYFDLLDEFVKGISIVRYLAPGCLGLIIWLNWALFSSIWSLFLQTFLQSCFALDCQGRRGSQRDTIWVDKVCALDVNTFLRLLVNIWFWGRLHLVMAQLNVGHHWFLTTFSPRRKLFIVLIWVKGVIFFTVGLLIIVYASKLSRLRIVLGLAI